MRAASTCLAIGTVLCLVSAGAHALGFGRVTNTTQLGQPLNFAAAVSVGADEDLPRECVSAEVTSGDSRLQPNQIRVTLEGSADAGTRSVRVTSSAMIDEPVVTVAVTLGCSSKVTRRFVAFIDPPSTATAQSETAVPFVMAPQRVDSQVAPLLAIVEGERTTSPVPRPAARASGARRSREPAVEPERNGAVVRDPAAPLQTTTPASPRRPVAPVRTAARQAKPGPRLQLDPAPLVAEINPAPAMAASLAAAEAASAAAASASAADAAARLAAERQQRLGALEENVAALRAQSAGTAQALAALQLRLKAAETERYANPLVYALAGLSALLAILVAALWWRQSHSRGGAQWWTAAPPTPEEVGAAEELLAPTVLVTEPEPATSPGVTAGVTAGDVLRVYRNEVIDSNETATRPAPFMASSIVVPVAEAPRELSVEELIDLEQQAEFFVVLGQDDAAIELLMSHVRSDGGISPLPYLKLLEIYRRRGETEAYERIRDRFNRRFNAYAPDWASDLTHGRILADYPETVARLQAIWETPKRVMKTLDASLFRRNRSDETYDLPAYRELLFLYSIARDLAEHGGEVGDGAKPASPVATHLPTQAVDLLLPIGDDEAPVEPISRLHATSPLDVGPPLEALTQPLDLDVTFGDSSITAPIETSPGAWQRSPQDDSHFIDFDLSEPAPPPRSEQSV